MIRVVADTNVLVSAIVFGGIPRKALQSGEQGLCTFIMAKQLTDETMDVLVRKFGWSRAQVTKHCRLLWDRAVWVEPVTSIEACRDPQDNYLLALAVDSGAAFIVTGDDDLISLDPFQGIRIVNPRTFVETVFSASG